MSEINHQVTNDMVIPKPFEKGNMFRGNESARFAVGIIAVGLEASDGLERAREAYMELRGNVYATQTRMIDASKLVQEGPNAGSEMPDEDDARSVHFGVLENLGDAVRLVGSMRHIVKGQNSDAPLPVELFFPQAFQDGDGKAPVGSFEVSRYIQRHEDLALQQLMTKPLLGKALTFALARGEEPAFGVVEEALERRLMKVGVPLKRIADPMMVPEYAADNLGIQIDLHEMGRRFGINPKVIAAARRQENQFTYFGTAPHIPVTGVA